MSPSEVIVFLALVGGIVLMVRFGCVRPHVPAPSPPLTFEEKLLKRIAYYTEAYEDQYLEGDRDALERAKELLRRWRQQQQQRH
jgi:hypothetical protein